MKCDIESIPSVRVGAIDFPVETKEIQEAGHCYIYPCKIEISKDLNDQERFEVLVHECVHAIAFLGECKMKERQVSVVGDGLLCLLRDNPQLMGMMMDYCNDGGAK